MKIQEIIQDGLAAVKQKDIEVYYNMNKTLDLSAFRKEISSFSQAETSGLSVRAVEDNRMGVAYTEKINEKILTETIAQAEENAKISVADDGNVLVDQTGQLSENRLMSKDLHSISLEDKKAATLKIEETAYAADSKIINVPHAAFKQIDRSNIIANSKGMLKQVDSSACFAAAYLMASDGSDTQIGFYVQVKRNFADLDFSLIAQKAAESAVSMLGAREMPSGKYPVLFSPEMASGLIEVFNGVFYGENIQKKRSKLAGKEGQIIASPLLNLVDDPAFGLGYKSFDDEGVDFCKTYVIKDGVFETVLHNSYSAARSGVTSTGHGVRGSYSSALGTALHNPYVVPGQKSEAELITDMHKGVYITTLEGLHAGVDPISGDFSLAAKGFYVENGQKSYAVKNITVAGNYFDLLKNIAAFGNALREDNYAGIAVPAMLVSELAIGGE